MVWVELNVLYPVLTTAVSLYFFIHEWRFWVQILIWSRGQGSSGHSTSLPVPLYVSFAVEKDQVCRNLSTKVCAAQWVMWWGRGPYAISLDSKFLSASQGENLSTRSSSWECGQADESKPQGGWRVIGMLSHTSTRNNKKQSIVLHLQKKKNTPFTHARSLLLGQKSFPEIFRHLFLNTA